MKRFWVTLVALLLVVAVVAAVSGCGGDTKQAKEDIKQADAKAEQVKNSFTEMSSKFSTAFSNISDPAQYEAAANDLKAYLAEVDKKAEAAIAAYAKVKTLKGVADYVKYSDLWTQILKLAEQLTAEMSSLLDEATKMVNSGDATGLTNLQTKYEANVTEITDKLTKLEEEANKLKADKNL